MSADELEVTPPAEEVTPEPELENPENQDQPTAEELADLRKKATAFEDQKKRAEKAEAELKKLKPKPDAEAPSNAGDLSPATQQRLDRIELNSLGIKDRDEQDFVLGAAKRLGVDPSQAAADPIVAGKLEAMREARKTKEATPAPSRAGGGTSTNITRLAEKALSTGELPPDPKLRAQVQAEMKRLTKK